MRSRNDWKAFESLVFCNVCTFAGQFLKTRCSGVLRLRKKTDDYLLKTTCKKCSIPVFNYNICRNGQRGFDDLEDMHNSKLTAEKFSMDSDEYPFLAIFLYNLFS